MPRDSQLIGSQPRIQKDETKTFYTRGFMLAFAPFVIITLLVVIFRKEHYESAYKIFTNKFFLFNIAIIILFSSVVLLQPDDEDDQTSTNQQRLEMAVKHGLIAAMIAIFAALDLKLAPFWLIFLTSYYLDME